MIKVAICINGLDIGGAEMVLFELLKQVPEDIEIHVYSLIDDGALAPRIAELGIPVTSLHMHRGVPSATGLFRLYKAFGKDRPDVVHTWLYHADLLGGIAAKLHGIDNVMWHLHNNDLTPGRVSLTTRLVVRACAVLSHWVPRRIICCGDEVRRVHIARGYAAEKMSVEPNGTDTTRFRPSAEDRTSVHQELGVSEETPLVGLIARYDPQKDHRTFFGAVRAFQEGGGNAHFLLAGRGVDSDNATLTKLQAELPDPAAVSLLGERHDIPRLMAALDIATSSSLGEAFPVSLLEAMASGAPCVVTDAGDSAAIVADTGIVVAPGDPAALARGWSEMLARPEAARVELGQRARERVVAHYTMYRLATRCWTIYREMAAAEGS